MAFGIRSGEFLCVSNILNRGFMRLHSVPNGADGGLSSRHIGKRMASTLRDLTEATETERALPEPLFDVLQLPVFCHVPRSVRAGAAILAHSPGNAHPGCRIRPIIQLVVLIDGVVRFLRHWLLQVA